MHTTDGDIARPSRLAIPVLCWLLAAASAGESKIEIELAAVVDLPTAKERRSAAAALAKRDGVTVDALIERARAFRPAGRQGRGGAGAGARTETVDLPVGGKSERTRISFYVPTAYAPDVAAPLILYLHGSHGRGEEAAGFWQSHAEATGAIVVAPTEAGENVGYAFTATERARAMAALRWARRRFNIDENRIHLTGVSRGGHMTWDLGGRRPDRWASLSPMIGGPRWLPTRGQQNLRFLENLAHLPLRDLQGERDQHGLLVNLRYAFARLDQLKAADAKFVTFADLGHSFRMEAVAWDSFLSAAKRNPSPKRIVRWSVAGDEGRGRAYWAEILAVHRNVKEKFAPKVDARTWGGLDELGQRKQMDAIVLARTARLEARWAGPNKFIVKTQRVKKFRLLLADGMFDAELPVEVIWNGRKRKKKLKRNARVLLDEFAERFDRTFLPVAEFRVP